MVDANEFYNELKKVDSRDRIFSVSFYGENFRESLYSTMNLKKAAIYYSENYDNVDHFTIDFCSNPHGGCNFVILDNLDKLISYNNKNNKYKKSNTMNEGIFNFNKFDMPLSQMDSYLGGQGKFMFSKQTNTYLYHGKELLQYGNSVYMNGINTGIGPSNGMVKIPRNSNYSCTTREEFNRMKKELSAWLSNELPKILRGKNSVKRAEDWSNEQGAEMQRKIGQNRSLIAQDQQDMQNSNYRKEANRAASYMGANPLREGACKKQRIKINENQLTQIIMESVKRILNESKDKKPNKLTNSFKSKEDMTAIRDKYSPYSQNSIIDTDNTVYDTDVEGGGEWGSGPYASYRSHSFADGYDYCGDDLYNDAADEYNRMLDKKLATKGGQMSDDWERFGPEEYPSKQKERDFERAYRDRGFKDWSDRSLEGAKKQMRGWVKRGHTNPEYEKFGMAEPDKRFGEDPFDSMDTSIYR